MTRKITVSPRWRDRLSKKFNLVHGFDGCFTGDFDGFKTYNSNGRMVMHFYIN